MATRLALISLSNKDGIEDFARGLIELDFEILSTGGSAAKLREAGVAVTEVADYCESPEVMNGRVKTLHPRIHGGILMRDSVSDREELQSIGGRPIDVVCVNLYPFEEKLKTGLAHDELVEFIDIGGPSMLRSAAKNHARVWVVTSPDDYALTLRGLASDDGLALRQNLAAKAFAHTASYDAAISTYMQAQCADGFAPTFSLSLTKGYDLRYGENPHQSAAFYREANAPQGSIAMARELGAGGKGLSFNNWVDVDAALDAVREFDLPAAVVVKHTNPCGVACGDVLADVYRRAREADAQSAFGGIVALNRDVDLETANAIAETFIECVVAPAFADDALERLRKKKNLRLLATGEWHGGQTWTTKRIGGGLLIQDSDPMADEASNAEVVTQRRPNDAEWKALDFAWRVCKHVKSNAIVLAKTTETVGIGAGQMSRVLAVEIAAKRAGENASGAVMASDAFFPFADGVQVAIDAGVTAVIQPGGSKRDAEVIAAANEAGIAMVMTGRRHFRH